MRVVVSYPGNFMHAQQAARAFHERGVLSAFVTGFAVTERSTLLRLCRWLPGHLVKRIARELGRRTVAEVPPDKIVCYPWLESLRTVLSRYAANPIYADMAWDALSHRFDQTVARRHLNGDVVHAFEYTAKSTFEAARRRGIATILAMPSRDSREFEEIKKAEEARFPEARSRYSTYFDERFARRYDRRRAEIELADMIVANSEATRQSHIRAGANPETIVSVPLAAPPPVAEIRKRDDLSLPLSVVWAGGFSLGKGAHYFLDAWRMLGAGSNARATVYGKLLLPEAALEPLSQGIEFKGSRARAEVMMAFDEADVLVFPTLADGFGMVVTEAFSRGLPVITTDRAGAGELVGHGRNGLIVPAGNAAALRDALLWCLDNRAQLYQMRKEALESARRWQWHHYRQRLVETISRQLHRSGYAVDLPLESVLFPDKCRPDRFASAS